MRYSAFVRVAATGAILAFAMPSQNSAFAQRTSNDQFARYTTPGQCEYAGHRLSRLYWRDKREDTVVYAPATDSLPASVVASVQSCLARFSVDGVAEHELLDLAQANLMIKQDDRAHAALARLLASPSQKDPIKRGWTLLKIVQSLMNAKSARFDAAQQYLKQLDALGDTVATWRLMAHTDVSVYALSVNDKQTGQSAARAAVAASPKMTRPDRLDFFRDILGAYAMLAEATIRVDHSPAHALAILDTAAVDIFPLRPEGSNHLESLKALWNTMRMGYLLSKPAPPLLADRWFTVNPGSGDVAVGQTPTFPVPGKVSLIVFVSANCGGNCYPSYSSIRRIQQEFGKKGVDVILMSTVSGWIHERNVEAEEEAQLIANYFQNFLELPVTVGVEFRQIQKRQPDGRLIRPETDNRVNYTGKSAILVHKNGMIGVSPPRLVPSEELLWRELLEDALKR